MARASGLGEPASGHPVLEERSTFVVRLPPVPTMRCTGWNGLSRMRGNSHVRFLEGGGLVTARLHSAELSDDRQEVIQDSRLQCGR
jgi:hypothetical protein